MKSFKILSCITKNTLVVLCFFLASCNNKSKNSVIKTDALVAPTSTIISYTEASKQLSQTEKIGQLFMPAAYINDDKENILALEKLISEQNIGALCFFHSRTSTATNFNGKQQEELNKDDLKNIKKLIARYQKAAKYPLLIAIDAEWGLAMRVENAPQYPYAITLGAMQNQSDLVYEVGRNIGKDLTEAGIHWNLAPVVDINNNPNNPVIGYRSFGDDKQKVTILGKSYIDGLHHSGVLNSLKHFPGHGDTATDSHIGLPVIEKTKEVLTNNELYPFQKLINDGVDAVMIGHLAVPALTKEKNTPTTLSKVTIKEVLRNEMNFQNAVISDALNMKSVSKLYTVKGELEWVAFDAGNDMLCFAENPKEGIAAILKNATADQIEESFKRIWKLKEKANTPVKTKPNKFTETALNQEIAKESLTLYKGNNEDITAIKESNFMGLAFDKTTENVFFKSINEQITFKQFSTKNEDLSIIKKTLKSEENIVIALYPPQIKPRNKFGLTANEIQLIEELSATKNVVLYVFGNPYVLNHIDIKNTKAVVIAYQNFEVFQENAAQHFLGKINAKGKLPVSL